MFFRMLAYPRDARSNQPARKVRQTLKICELMTARRTIKAALGPSPSARSADRIPPTCGTGRRSAAPLSTSHEHEGANPRSRRLTIRESLRLSLTIRKRPIAQGLTGSSVGLCGGHACDRPGLHRDPADVEELRSARAITRLDGQAADDRVDEGGQRVDVDIARHIAIPNAFSDARCKVDLRSRSILSHHVADGRESGP